MGGGGGRWAAASSSAAARRSPNHAWSHPPYRYAQSRALSTPPPLSTSQGWSKGTRKYTLPAAHSATTPAPGAAAPCWREKAAEAGKRNPRRYARGWGWAAEVRTAALRPPHCGAHRPSPAPPRTVCVLKKHWRPGSPRRPQPGSAASPPPRRSPSAGQPRGSGVLPAWARAPPPAAPEPAREAAPEFDGVHNPILEIRKLRCGESPTISPLRVSKAF